MFYGISSPNQKKKFVRSVWALALIVCLAGGLSIAAIRQQVWPLVFSASASKAETPQPARMATQPRNSLKPASSAALAGTLGGTFELDGNAIESGATPGEDWNQLFPTATSTTPIATTFAADPVVNGSDATTFTSGGSKDDLNIGSWRHTAGTSQDKAEITNAYAALYKDPDNGDQYLYFGADRFSNDGDTTMGFWFFQNPVTLNADGTFSGTHTVGDLLIVSDFDNGGGTSTVTAFRWVGSGGSHGTLNQISLGANAFAIVNSAPQTAPWPYTPKANVGSPGTFPIGCFFEGGINLSQALPNAGNTCFSAFLAETRASTSVNSTLSDFVLGSFETCKLEITSGVGGADVCAQNAQVTIPLTVTNSGIASLTVNITDDNGTPANAGDDIAIASNVVISPGTSQNFNHSFTPTSTTTHTIKSVGTNGTTTIIDTLEFTATVNTCSIGLTKAPSVPTLCGSGQVTYTYTVTNTGNKFKADGSIVDDNGTPGNIADDVAIGSFTNLMPGASQQFMYATTLSGTTTNIATASGTTGPTGQSVQVTAMANATVTVNPLPVVSANGGVLTCVVTSVQLSATSSVPGSAFSWSGLGIVSGGDTATPTVNAPGTYEVTVTSPAGCISKGSAEVTEDKTAPNVEAGSGKTLTCATTSVTLDGSSSTNGATASWSGPDGFTSTSFTPAVSVPGTYTLEVTGPNGCKATDTVEVGQDIIKPEVSAAAGGVLTCAVQSTTVTATSATAVSYSWSGPGIVSGGDTATATVNQPGAYIVTATGANGCTNTAQVEVTQDITKPNVSATAGDALTCTKLTTTVSASSSTPSVTFSWAGPGIVGSNSDPTITVNKAGAYTVTATAPNGCTETAMAQVSEDLSKPDVSASAGEMLTCTKATTTMTASSMTATAYNWSGPGVVSGGDTATATVNQPGLYTVTVTGPNGCTNDAQVEVKQDISKPAVSAAAGDALTCVKTTTTVTATSADAVSYSWAGPGIVGSNTGATITVDKPGNYTVTVTAANGCTNEASAEVQQDIAEPDVQVGPDQALNCTTKEVKLSADSITAGATFNWTTSDGHIVSGANTNMPVVDKAGSYLVTVTGANGCTSSKSVTVTEDTTAPDVNAGVDKTLDCATGSVKLEGSSSTSGATAAWTGPDGFTSTEFQPTVTKAGTYTLKVTGPNGCTAEDSVVVSPCVASFCSLTQGAYGNSKGKFNGEDRLTLISRLIGAPGPFGSLTIGKTGALGRSLTFVDGSESCIIQRLPAGRTANAFPSGMGNLIVGSDCGILPSLLSNGKFNNILIGQTLTLSLNVRLDPELGDLAFCNTMVTRKALPGPDGLIGTQDDIPDPNPGLDGILNTADDTLTVTIPGSVRLALTSLGLPQTVNGILELANRALAGQDTKGATFADINAAADAINRGFDECRFLVMCTN